eukprot:Awhi_evm1s1552
MRRSGCPSYKGGGFTCPLKRGNRTTLDGFRGAQSLNRVTNRGIESKDSKPLQVKKFKVVWCKKSTRKHKQWVDDADLSVNFNGGVATLTDLQGKFLDRATLTSIELSQIDVGEIVTINEREAEILEIVDDENSTPSNKCNNNKNGNNNSNINNNIHQSCTESINNNNRNQKYTFKNRKLTQ